MPTRAKAKAKKGKRAASPAALAFSLTIQYATTDVAVPQRAQFRRWVRAALQRPSTITIRVVDADEAAALNRQYRAKAYATNVLTFVYDDSPQGAGLSADIVLCAPVLAKEAAEQRKELHAHYAHLTIHGMLHAQGYDHEQDSDARIMEQLEIDVLAALGLENPYQVERAAATRVARKRAATTTR